MTTIHQVEVGQVWADNDWRADGRKIEVVELTPTHAICVVVANAAGANSVGKRTKIRLDRFRPTSTGYRLVGDEVTR